MLRLLSALLLTAILVFVSQGCSFLLGDLYGDYMQKADRWVDLRGTFQTKGLALNSLNGLSAVKGSFGGTPYSYVFFVATFADNTSSIGALGYDSLGLTDFDISRTQGALAPGADLDGDIKIEGQRYYANSLSTDWSRTLPTYTSSTVPTRWCIADAADVTNYLFYTNSSYQLRIRGYTEAWTTSSSGTWPISATESWNLARAERLADGRICLLFFLGNGGQGVVASVTFASFSDFPTATFVTYLMNSTSTDLSFSARIAVNTPNGSYNGPSGIAAWITDDGIVALTTNNNNRCTLTRYSFGPGGAIDSYSLTVNQNDLFYFEPSGQYWYLFDSEPGRLIRFRTWWK
jgi:hypothetical protein